MPATMILWSHALAALLFAGVALTRWRDAGSTLPRLTFVVALGATALWALAVAGIDARDVTAQIAESVRNLAWLGFMFALLRRDRHTPGARAVTMIYGVVAAIILLGMGLTVAEEIIGRSANTALMSVRILLRMMVALSALMLLNHLYVTVAPRARSGIRLVAIALAAMWLADLLIYAVAYAGGRTSGELLLGRGIVMALAAPVLAAAVQRNGDWTLQLSRTVAWQTLSFAAALLYGAAMLLATSWIAGVAGANARLLQAAFVFGSTAAVLTVISSPWVRAWTKVKLAKHFFRHRYDYRAEWVRFTDTLGKPDDAAPLDERIVKAVADLTDSPAGLLLVPDGAGLGVGTGWNWDGAALLTAGGDEPLAAYLAGSGRIVELDTVRAERADPAELASVPEWMIATDAWALVPLAHLGKLQGAILLARPPIDRALDWEDLDLLRIAGRQVASYLAEARAQDALGEAQRFDEFNRRFAFIMHDVKNLVSQLTLVARNAERHADNPDFRADMIATLKDSVERMNALLARLSQHHSGRGEDLRPVALLALVHTLAARRRGQHPIAVIGDETARAMADPARLEQVIEHLLQNAIEASPASEPVTLAISASGDTAVIEVIDQGAGMSPAFLRDQLFRAFASSKPGGFGIGAFEARQLTEGMGGSITVTSREGEGTRFRLAFPAARATPIDLEQAA
ncbi:MAG: PEP-CTERM system histidine kinase PrsK [Pseudomonadota bacterium]|nr:PEP-CTERM system histidine kinase PrsK [Pseudomonadota bacterium]